MEIKDVILRKEYTMRTLKIDELKKSVYELAKKTELLPKGIGKRKFFSFITKYVSLPIYCRLVIRVLKNKGVDMEMMRAKCMLVYNIRSSHEKRRKK